MIRSWLIGLGSGQANDDDDDGIYDLNDFEVIDRPLPAPPSPVQIPIPAPGTPGVGDIVALDFETANEMRASPCSIGLAWLDGGLLTHTAHRLIRPKELRFDGFNVSIHGICEEHVEDQPEFPDLWHEILPHVRGGIALAHNASFDMSVLRATLDLYGIPWPELGYLCTVKVAREVWPDLPDYKLSTVAGHLGIDLTHHDASSDAEACATIAIRAMEAVGASSLTELADLLGIRIGRVAPGWYTPCSSPSRKRTADKAPPARFVEAIQRARATSLQGKTVVFTGTLETMLRAEAAAIVKAVGGIWQPGIRRDTDYLVVGTDPGGAKLAKAAKQMDKLGRPILIDEREFLQMMGI